MRVLESQLNDNIITGVVQNRHNYSVGDMTVRAVFRVIGTLNCD